ncbi:hypothetical protein FBZ90_111215 [Nitrospirillum pindoramense]|uniref:Uncharacterized protein n=1 Tax=Nitrospirillum amazonense TaxID=28077 RepID=A0A560GYW0_9PROT|nr:hypothetical protein FBZ90_111215 [Nitrospirillum amazonense]
MTIPVFTLDNRSAKVRQQLDSSAGLKIHIAQRLCYLRT